MFDDDEADDECYSLCEDDSFADSDDILELARIQEYQQQSLRDQDPLAATLGRITGGMAEIVLQQDRALKAAISDGRDLGKSEVRAGMGNYLALTRQLERNVGLTTRYVESRLEKSSRSTRRRGLL